MLGAGGASLVYALNQSVKASDLTLHTTNFPWSHDGVFSSLDHASIRRGYEVSHSPCFKDFILVELIEFLYFFQYSYNYIVLYNVFEIIINL